MRNRHAGSARFGALAGTAVLLCGLVSVLLAGTRAATALAAKNLCATRPAATTVASALNARPHKGIALVASVSGRSSSPTSASSPSLTPAAAASSSTSPAPKPSPIKSTKAPSNSPSPSTSPSKSTNGPSPGTSPTPNKSTPVPSKSPSPSPSKSKSPSPSPSPTPNRKTAHLCVSVQPLGSKARVHPGSTATYVIWVWTTRAAAKKVTVNAAIRHVKGVGTARFTVCPSRHGSTCALGDLPRGRADELRAQVKVRKAAHSGRHVTLTAKAKAKGATSGSAAGSVKIVSTRAPASPAPTTPPSTPPIPPLPPIPPAPAPAAVGGTSPAGLFPTVSPQPSTGPPSGSAAAGHKNSRAIKATSATDTLPLNPRLIGGQLAGLVVLAAAITIAIARLSLRPQRPQDGDGSSGEH